MSATSRQLGVVPESLLPGASSMVTIEAQRRFDTIARAVARIDFADQTSGTGILLGGRWLLTCHHVVPSLERARVVKAVIFGFERSHTDQLQAGVSVALAPDQGFHTQEADDWTLVRLSADDRLAPFGHSYLFDDPYTQIGAEARVVQHPGAREKSVATGPIVEADGGRVRYRINTEGGSSGAPVINTDGKIIALHHAGGGDHNQGVAIQRVIAGIRALGGDLWNTLSQPASPLAPQPPQRIAPTRLVARHTAADFLGRDDELRLLDRVWRRQDGVVNLFSLIAWGGVGKTALMAHWVRSRFAAAGWRNADGQPEPDAYFDWTFYDQGMHSAHNDDSQHAGAASLGAFFQTALKHFGDPDAENPQDKVERLAALIQSQRTLLILDGLEPLQYPPNHPQAGQLTDPDLHELLGRLAQLNPGLCLISSRQPLSDLPASETGLVRAHPLEELPLAAAIHLLCRMGVKGTDEEMAQAAEDYFRHALSLTVLGRFLAVKGGDIRQRDRVKFEAASETRNQRITRNAWHVLEAYEAWLASPEGNLADAQALRLAGLFDRPASPDCLSALRRAPAIPGLTDALLSLSDDAWNAVLMRLHEAHLIQLRFPADDPASWAPRPEPRHVALDAHPLIREYFAKRLREQNAEAFQAAHSRLFDHLCRTTEHRPDTLEGLQPLYQAVGHGCLAGRQEEALYEVFIDRILRGTQSGGFYSQNNLGAIDANLGAVAAFFDKPWCDLAQNLRQPAQGWLLNEAAASLLLFGRLIEAREPMRVGLEMAINSRNWHNAVTGANNLSGLEVTLGLLDDATSSARNAITFSDQCDEWYQRMLCRAAAAEALCQRGALADQSEVIDLFEQAEKLQRKNQPQCQWLYSLQGFAYSDLILAQALRVVWQVVVEGVRDAGDSLSATAVGPQPSWLRDGTKLLKLAPSKKQKAWLSQTLVKAERRATRTLKVSTANGHLRDIALDRLTLARVALYRALLAIQRPLSIDHSNLSIALQGLRKAGQLNHLPKALLTAALHHHTVSHDPEAAERFLAEAQRIAERGPMPLYLADVHLHRARLFRDKAALEKARALIQQHGYGRRREELADADVAARFW